MTEKEPWIERCANRYIERAGLSREDATDAAEVCWAEIERDAASFAGEKPEDMADADMDAWDDDL